MCHRKYVYNKKDLLKYIELKIHQLQNEIKNVDNTSIYGSRKYLTKYLNKIIEYKKRLEQNKDLYKRDIDWIIEYKNNNDIKKIIKLQNKQNDIDLKKIKEDKKKYSIIIDKYIFNFFRYAYPSNNILYK